LKAIFVISNFHEFENILSAYLCSSAQDKVLICEENTNDYFKLYEEELEVYSIKNIKLDILKYSFRINKEKIRLYCNHYSGITNLVMAAKYEVVEVIYVNEFKNFETIEFTSLSLKDKIYKKLYKLINHTQITKFETKSGINSWGLQKRSYQNTPALNLKLVNHEYEAILLDFFIDEQLISINPTIQNIKKILLNYKKIILKEHPHHKGILAKTLEIDSQFKKIPAEALANNKTDLIFLRSASVRGNFKNKINILNLINYKDEKERKKEKDKIYFDLEIYKIDREEIEWAN